MTRPRGVVVDEAWAHDRPTATTVSVRRAVDPGGATTTLTLLTADGRRTQRSSREGPGADAAARLDAAGTTGHLGRSAWDLRFDRPAGVTGRRMGLGVDVPGPTLAVTGTVTHQGRELHLAGARGAHVRVRDPARAPGWALLHATDLRLEDGDVPLPDDHLTALCAVVATRPGAAAGRPVLLVRGRLLGRPVRALVLPWRGRPAPAPSPTRFELAVAGAGRVLVVRATCPPERLLADAVRGPGGDERWCYNSPMADLRVEVSVPGRAPEALVGRAGLACAGTRPA